MTLHKYVCHNKIVFVRHSPNITDHNSVQFGYVVHIVHWYVDHHMFSGGLQENLAHLLASIHLSVLQVTSNKHIQHPHVNNELYEYFVERYG